MTAALHHVQGNPRDVHCLESADVARDLGVALVVGVGGGSAIDTAKCIALLVTNGGHPRDWEDFGALRHDPLPTIAVPTTAGTGSEVSPSAIITDTERRKKMNLFDPRICPDVALVDPDLTLSMPARLTAATGMDALSHAVDSLHCRLANPASDALALEGARLVALYLERAVVDGDDVEARCGMAQASLTAGLAVGITACPAAIAWPRRSAGSTTTRTASAAPPPCRSSWTSTLKYAGIGTRGWRRRSGWRWRASRRMTRPVRRLGMCAG